jgi:hypothetical protein
VIKYRGQPDESAIFECEKGNITESAVDSLAEIIAGTKRNSKATYGQVSEVPHADLGSKFSIGANNGSNSHHFPVQKKPELFGSG